MKRLLAQMDRTVSLLSVTLLIISGTFLLFAVFYRYIVMTWMSELADSYLWVENIFIYLDDSLGDISATTDEIPGFILVWVSFLGAYLAEREEKHIRFDMLVEALPSRFKVFIEMSMHALLVLFFAMLFYFSVDMIIIDGATEIETAEIGQGWFMLILPLASALMVISIGINIFKGFTCSSSQS